jgi:hypothetical protein
MAQSLVATPNLRLKVSHDQVVVMNQTIRSKVPSPPQPAISVVVWSLSLPSCHSLRPKKAAGEEAATEHRARTQGVDPVRPPRRSGLAAHAPPVVAVVAPAARRHARKGCGLALRRSGHALHTLRRFVVPLHTVLVDAGRRPAAVALPLQPARLAIDPAPLHWYAPGLGGVDGNHHAREHDA